MPSATDLSTGDTSNITAIVVTENTPPMIVGDALTPEILEGGLATLSGRLVDPDIGDFLTLRVTWGDHTPSSSSTPARACSLSTTGMSRTAPTTCTSSGKTATAARIAARELSLWPNGRRY